MTCVLKHVSKPYDEFYFKEKYFSLCFNEYKNSKLNLFNPISKRAKFFRVLQFYPLKMNLVLEIRKTSTRR